MQPPLLHVPPVAPVAPKRVVLAGVHDGVAWIGLPAAAFGLNAVDGCCGCLLPELVLLPLQKIPPFVLLLGLANGCLQHLIPRLRGGHRGAGRPTHGQPSTRTANRPRQPKATPSQGGAPMERLSERLYRCTQLTSLGLLGRLRPVDRPVGLLGVQQSTVQHYSCQMWCVPTAVFYSTQYKIQYCNLSRLSSFLGPLFGLPEIGEKRPRFPLH